MAIQKSCCEKRGKYELEERTKNAFSFFWYLKVEQWRAKTVRNWPSPHCPDCAADRKNGNGTLQNSIRNIPPRLSASEFIFECKTGPMISISISSRSSPLCPGCFPGQPAGVLSIAHGALPCSTTTAMAGPQISHYSTAQFHFFCLAATASRGRKTKQFCPPLPAQVPPIRKSNSHG